MDSQLFREHRIKISITGTKPLLRDPGWKAGQYEGQIGIWAGFDDHNNVQMRQGIHNTMSVPVSYITPLRPEIPGQKAICLAGESFGACYVVVSVKDGVCVLRKPEDKKKKNLIPIPVLDLATLV